MNKKYKKFYDKNIVPYVGRDETTEERRVNRIKHLRKEVESVYGKK